MKKHQQSYVAENICVLSLEAIIQTRRVPVEGKSSVSLICMKYWITILIIIIISLGEMVLSYIANTSGTRARTHVHTAPFRVGAPKRDEVNDPHSWPVAGSLK